VTIVWQVEQFIHGIELRHPAQMSILSRPKMADAHIEAASQMLDA
jgi:hypothetical protein